MWRVFDFFIFSSLKSIKLRTVKEEPGILSLKTLALAASLISLTIAVSFAEDRSVTPYGDYCRECTNYGVCRDVLPRADAVHVLVNYFRNRGYRVVSVFHKGRFIEADIFKNERYVDKVVFDRKTGRIRSIY